MAKIDKAAKPYYWRHTCPAGSLGDGDSKLDDVPPPSHAHQHLQYIKIDKSSPGGCPKEGEKCPALGCKYQVNEETVLVRKNKTEEIRKVGGENLDEGRLQCSYMMCCGMGTLRGCGKLVSAGHDFQNPTGYHSRYDPHYLSEHYRKCRHAKDYPLDEEGNKPEKRREGCECVWVNGNRESVAFWEPNHRNVIPVPGGPLDLDRKYREKRGLKIWPWLPWCSALWYTLAKEYEAARRAGTQQEE